MTSRIGFRAGGRADLPFRIARFTAERFPLQLYGLLIAALVACGTAAAAIGPAAPVVLDARVLVAWTTLTAAFLVLRILDDLRDGRADGLGRPDRPLPRGLVSARELRWFAATAAAFGVGLAAALGGPALASYVVVLGAIGLLGLDVPGRLGWRSGVLGTLLVHSVIAPLAVAFVWTTHAGLAVSPALGATLALVWGAGVAAEIGRKTLLPEEERVGVETYSARVGRSRAVNLAALALSWAWASAAALGILAGPSFVSVGWPLAAALGIALLARPLAGRLSSSSLQASTSVLVLAVLLWPVLIVLSMR